MYLKNQLNYDDLSEFFSVLSNITRIKILYALENKDMSVSDLANLLDIRQSSISHQLRILYKKKIVIFTRKGRRKFYYLNNLNTIDILDDTLKHIIINGGIKNDKEI